jgi:hypothetical protein
VAKNTVVRDALDNIRKLIAEKEKVAFVVNFWMPHNNLGMSGFRFPQYPDAYIPPSTLLPLVTITQKHIDSFINPMNGKVTPFDTPFEQDIRQSITDLQRRFGKYGLVELPNLACTLEETDELIEAFDFMMDGFKGTLQDLPYFFGSTSPVEIQFDNPISRLDKTPEGDPITYDKVLSQLVSSGKISEKNFRRLMASVNEFIQSAEIAHRAALTPQDGILHRTILSMNTGKKDGLDEADIWLTRQFPDFNAQGRLKGKENSSDLGKLVEMLGDRLGGSPQAQAQAPAQANLLSMLLNATPAEKALLRQFLGAETIQAVDPEVPAEVPSTPLPSTLSVDTEEAGEEEIEEVSLEESADSAQGLVPTDPVQCYGKTKGSNFQDRCNSNAEQDHYTCFAHRTQEEAIVAEFAETRRLALEAKAEETK